MVQGRGEKRRILHSGARGRVFIHVRNRPLPKARVFENVRKRGQDEEKRGRDEETSNSKRVD